MRTPDGLWLSRRTRIRVTYLTLVLVTISMSLVLTPSLARGEATPANDNFASAQTLVLGQDVGGTLSNATLEPAEARPPEFCHTYGRTVWYRFTTDVPVPVAIKAWRPGYEKGYWPPAAVYEGNTMQSLLFLNCSDSYDGNWAGFLAEKGKTYYVQVGGGTAWLDQFVLRLQLGSAQGPGHLILDGRGDLEAGWCFGELTCNEVGTPPPPVGPAGFVVVADLHRSNSDAVVPGYGCTPAAPLRCVPHGHSDAESLRIAGPSLEYTSSTPAVWGSGGAFPGTTRYARLSLDCTWVGQRKVIHATGILRGNLIAYTSDGIHEEVTIESGNRVYVSLAPSGVANWRVAWNHPRGDEPCGGISVADLDAPTFTGVVKAA